MSLFHTIDIRFADPISAIGMNSNFIVVGSMMGRLAMLNLAEKKYSLLAELSTENITGISFENEYTCNISVGDEEIVKYKFDLTGNNHECQRFSNYDNEGSHKMKCEITYCLLSESHLLMVELNQQTENGNINIATSPNPIKLKNVVTGNMYDFEILMTNYSIPFDFDGKRFLWVEFMNEKERNICMYDFEEMKKWEYKLTQKFGHISFCRLLDGNQILLVRQLNDVEIRDMNEDLTLKYSFTNIGDEIISLDYYFLDEVDKSAGKSVKVDNEKMLVVDEKKVEETKKIKIESQDSKLNIKQILVIILVDIDGNVNMIKNYQPTSKKFNMYQVKDIPQDIKDKQFFSMGYPYYVKANQELIAISSDYGVFVFKNN